MKLGILINTFNWNNFIQCILLLCCIPVVISDDQIATTTSTATAYISTTTEFTSTPTDNGRTETDFIITKLPSTTQESSTSTTITTTLSSRTPDAVVSTTTTTTTADPTTVKPTTTTNPTTTTTTRTTPKSTTTAFTVTTKVPKIVEPSTTEALRVSTTTTTEEPRITITEDPAVECVARNQLQFDVRPKNKNNNFDFIVNVTKGDIVITIISTKYTSAPFIAKRINELKLIRENITLGVRHILVVNVSVVQEVLETEARYLKECEKYPIGIFLAHDLWHLVKGYARDMGFNVWATPNLDRLRFVSIAKLFYELPWAKKPASVEVLTENEVLKETFIAAAQTEKMCFGHRLNETTLQIVLGDDITPEANVTAVIVHLKEKRDFSQIKEGYVIAEAELDLNRTRKGQPRQPAYMVLPTDFLIHGSLLLEIAQWLNDSINSNCLRRNAHLGVGGCSTILQDTPQISYAYMNAPHDLMHILNTESYLDILKFELLEKTNDKLKVIASLSLVNNVTTIYRQLPKYRNGTVMNAKLGQYLSCTAPNITKVEDFNPIRNYEREFYKSFWRIRAESWVAAGLTIAIIGIVICLAILTFIFSRICIQDVLEGNPTCSILLLFALILQFASFVPFSVEYTGYHTNSSSTDDTLEKWNTHCSVKIFLVSLCYCLTFSLLLCRAVMLASIGTEGGFLSHVNGYIQSIICFFSTLVQIALSTQLLVIMNTTKQPSCSDFYFGHWFWSVVGYDGFLLVLLLILAPFVIKSQRNYKEGLLIVIGSGLVLVCWCIWVPLCLLGDEWREIAVPMGAQGTAMAILIGIMVPRFVLILKSIARSDLVQALPSLTSLAFAQAATQYASEQKYFQNMYDCVNPTMRSSHNMTGQTEHTFIDSDLEEGGNPSPSQVPTLPLRTNRNFGNINHYYRQHNGHANNNNNNNNNIDSNNEDSQQLNLPPSPDKMTRF